MPTLSEIEELFKERRPAMGMANVFDYEGAVSRDTHQEALEQIASANQRIEGLRALRNNLIRERDEARTKNQVLENQLDKLKAAVQEKAQEVYDSGDSICLDGTNEWLTGLGLQPLRVRTTYQFKVPAELIYDITVTGSEEEARRVLRDAFCELAYDTDDVDLSQVNVIIDGQRDSSWYTKAPLIDTCVVD